MKGLAIVIFALGLAAPGIQAHHNWAATFDVESDVEIRGSISSIEWRNPHVRLAVTVNQGENDEMTWQIESGSVASLSRMDIDKELLAIGQTVRIAGYKSRSSETGVFMNHLQLSDGREVIFLRGAKPRWEGANIGTTDKLHGLVVEEDISKRPASIFAVWTTVFGDPGSHKALENDPVVWTEGALEVLANNENTGADPLVNCNPKGMPLAIGAPYPIELIDDGENILVRMEEYDAVRTIHMTDIHDDENAVASTLGYSTGRWVGDVLTVTTTKMNYGLTPGTAPQGLGMQLHETFQLREDRNYLDYTQVIIDPEMRVTPNIEKKWFKWRPGEEIQPYSCSY